MKCNNCGKEENALISLKGSADIEKETDGLCMDCIKDWLSNVTFVKDDGTLLRNGKVVGHTENKK